MMQLEDSSSKRKSFWERPEGTTGMIALAAGGVGLFFALPTLTALMAGLITLLGQTVAVVALCILLAAILFLVTNKQVRTAVSYMFKSAMRKITGVLVEIDPIGIMKSYIEDLKKKRVIMLDAKDTLNGQITILEAKIKKNDTGYNNAMATAKVAKDKGMHGQVTVNSRQAGRLQKLNEESFRPLLAKMQVHLRALNKYYEVTGTVIDDLGNEIEARKMERDMIMASYSAMSAAKKILMGGGAQKELFDQAMDYVVEDYGLKLGAIESFIDNSKGFVEGLDLQNGVYEEDALRKLEAWENKADDILLGTAEKQKLVEHTINSPMYQGIGVPAAHVDYSQLISRK